VKSDTNLEPEIFLNVTNAPPGIIKWAFHPGLNSSTSDVSAGGDSSGASASSFILPQSGKATIKLEVESIQDVISTSSYSLDIFLQRIFLFVNRHRPHSKNEFQKSGTFSTG
jgi:hypothetical protein